MRHQPEKTAHKAKNGYIRYNHADYKMKYGMNYSGVKQCPNCRKPTPHIITRWKKAAAKSMPGSGPGITPLTSVDISRQPDQIECLFCWQRKQGIRVL